MLRGETQADRVSLLLGLFADGACSADPSLTSHHMIYNYVIKAAHMRPDPKACKTLGAYQSLLSGRLTTSHWSLLRHLTNQYGGEVMNNVRLHKPERQCLSARSFFWKRISGLNVYTFN